MSPVGHSIVGLTLAVIALPYGASRRVLILVPIVFVALANLPDWPIPNWGHDRYRISHSLFINLLLIGLSVFAIWLIKRRFQLPIARITAFGAIAWLSHLLLDTFYAHGRGLAMFWPFSEARLSLPVPWFQVLNVQAPIWSERNLLVFGYEALVYTPILLVALAIRFAFCRCCPPSEQPIQRSQSDD